MHPATMPVLSIKALIKDRKKCSICSSLDKSNPDVGRERRPSQSSHSRKPNDKSAVVNRARGISDGYMYDSFNVYDARTGYDNRNGYIASIGRTDRSSRPNSSKNRDHGTVRDKSAVRSAALSLNANDGTTVIHNDESRPRARNAAGGKSNRTNDSARREKRRSAINTNNPNCNYENLANPVKSQSSRNSNHGDNKSSEARNRNCALADEVIANPNLLRDAKKEGSTLVASIKR